MKWRVRGQPPEPEGAAFASQGQSSSGPSHPEASELFADRYTELRLLGRGGFGEVYSAWDTKMERSVALKLLKRDLALDADWRKRFRQEATRNLLHPNITINFDVGEYEGQLFIVMELVEGEPLGKLIERQVPLSIPERLLLIEQLCDGLHYAHTQKVVHRDIKPANLMVCEKLQDDRIVRTLKILDFGIAKVVSTEETSTGSFMFSPPYVSPEQVMGEAADERSDMFAVGAVAYELLSYQKAFDIKSRNLFEILNEVRRKNAEEPHRPLLEIRPDMDPQLSAVIDRSLAKSPAARFRTLGEMGRELRKIRERLEDSAGDEPAETVALSQTVQTTVREAREALESGDPTSALSKLENALLSRLSRSERRLLEEILADARERHSLKSGARYEEERAAAAEAIVRAREVFASGQRTAAIDQLSRFEPIELVVDELETLRAIRAALTHGKRAVSVGTNEQGREIIDDLERSYRPELVADEVARLRQLVDSRPGTQEVAPADIRTAGAIRGAASGTQGGRTATGPPPAAPEPARRKLATTAVLLLVTGLVVGSAYMWWPFADTPPESDGAGATARPDDLSADVRQRTADLWAQGRRDDALKELEDAISRWPQDGSVAQMRERFAAEAKASSEEARLRAEAAGGAADPLFKVGTDAAARAHAHAAAGRHFDSIHAYLDAAARYDHALENAGPVAEVDGYLKSGDRARGLDALVRGLKKTPHNTALAQRLDNLRASAIEEAQAAHQALTRKKDFDQAAPDYLATRKEFGAARLQAGPDAVQRLWGVAARFSAAAEKMSEAAALHRAGLEHARAGRRQEALASLRDAKLRFAGYKATRQLAQDLRDLAAGQAQRAKRAAAEAGATLQITAFAEAVQAEQRASGAARDEEAIELWRDATGFYELAEKEARRSPPTAKPTTDPEEKSATNSPSSRRSADGGSGTATAGTGSVAEVKPPAPPVKPPDNPPPPTRPSRDEAAEKREVLTVIEQYQRGYERMDPGAILTVYPTFSRERQRSLEQARADCKSYPVRFVTPPNIDITGANTAVVSVKAEYGCERRSGSVRSYGEETEFFRLQRENGRWLIKEMPGK